MLQGIQILFTSILIFFVLLIGYMYVQARKVNIRRQDLTLPNWPKGFDGVCFLLISDLHRCRIPDQVRQELNKEKFDLVLIAGDITEKNVPLSRVEDNIAFLHSLAPSYFVWGNHDYNTDFRALDSMLRDIGVTVLDNTAVSFESGQDRLWLVGVDDYLLKRDNLELALSDIDQEGYRLLLSHNPFIIEKLNKNHHIKGILSGHTHGGQICLPFLGAIFGANGRLFPNIISGEYMLEDMNTKLFVSNGVGTSKIPLRLLAPPEIHILTMKS